MTTFNAYIARNPKFTDSFERELANDESRHLGRDEPSVFKPMVARLAAVFAAVSGAVLFLRASAQRAGKHRQAS
ncbi:hypothetical protein QTH87_05480 [Variovorax sp. J22P168]|uniref:hypothetical protein n=1 Tax=Variovorax jilinensis TaxID=3053513 RepID=UPI0025773C08|nr:hypothetical protein [Variovorax sp. J22P168]MDM0011887.1 hypothetical protein [Variovorax sp. J22P168]